VCAQARVCCNQGVLQPRCTATQGVLQPSVHLLNPNLFNAIAAHPLPGLRCSVHSPEQTPPRQGSEAAHVLCVAWLHADSWLCGAGVPEGFEVLHMGGPHTRLQAGYYLVVLALDHVRFSNVSATSCACAANTCKGTRRLPPGRLRKLAHLRS
jgi:hypothetical protein